MELGNISLSVEHTLEDPNIDGMGVGMGTTLEDGRTCEITVNKSYDKVVIHLPTKEDPTITQFMILNVEELFTKVIELALTNNL